MLKIEQSAKEFFAEFKRVDPDAAAKMTADLEKFETADLIGCLREAPRRAKTVGDLMILARVLTYMILERKDEASEKFRAEMTAVEETVDAALADDSPCDCPKCTALRENMH